MAELAEFRAAQDEVWPEVVAQLGAGRKTGHWIWFVFPQLAGLGRSALAQNFGLSGTEDARAYQSDPVLGPRLSEAAALLLEHRGTAPEEILGAVDALKVRSSMTLFETVPGAPAVYARVLDDMYDGTRCEWTRARLTG